MFPFQLFGFISFMLQSNLEQQLDHWYFSTETSCNILSIKKCFRLIKAFWKRNSFSPSIRFLFSLEGRVIDARVAEKPQVKTWGKKTGFDDDLSCCWRILLSSSSPTGSLELLLPAWTSKSIGLNLMDRFFAFQFLPHRQRFLWALYSMDVRLIQRILRLSGVWR